MRKMKEGAVPLLKVVLVSLAFLGGNSPLHWFAFHILLVEQFFFKTVNVIGLSDISFHCREFYQREKSDPD